MKYNFDLEISRENSSSVKWEYFLDGDTPGSHRYSDAAFGPDRVLPMWIADMDFPAPQPVTDALAARAMHSIYGYTWPSDAYYAAITGWMERRHGWRVAPEWIVPTPGIVAALNLLVRTFVAPGEKVLIQTPVYQPFFKSITNNDAQIVVNPLVPQGNSYVMDFEDLAARLEDPGVKLAILCSPHNPVGRVWSRDELRRFGELCLERQVPVIADEIHGDLILPGHTFTPMAGISAELADNTIACTAPSKTFNLAGLKTSHLIISNPALRQRFTQTLNRTGVSGVNTFGMVATQAAYTAGADWLDQVLHYIDGNRRTLEAFLAQHLPQLCVARLEGTYLAWIDCRALDVNPKELRQFLLEQARVLVEDGAKFGPEGVGFIRLNIACTRSVLVEALERIRAAAGQTLQGQS